MDYEVYFHGLKFWLALTYLRRGFYLMNPEQFVKKELRLSVIISNLECNLTYGAIIALLKKYDYYKTLEEQISKVVHKEESTEGDGG